MTSASRPVMSSAMPATEPSRRQKKRPERELRPLRVVQRRVGCYTGPLHQTRGQEMIKDEELAELSDDPEWAFVEYERTVRQRANAAINEAQEKEIDADEYRIDYISHVLAAAKALRLDFLSSWKVPSVSQGGIAERYLQFQSDVNFVTLQIRFEHARRVKRYSV